MERKEKTTFSFTGTDVHRWVLIPKSQSHREKGEFKVFGRLSFRDWWDPITCLKMTELFFQVVQNTRCTGKRSSLSKNSFYVTQKDSSPLKGHRHRVLQAFCQQTRPYKNRQDEDLWLVLKPLVWNPLTRTCNYSLYSMRRAPGLLVAQWDEIYVSPPR